jgi:hypothetical protein
MEGNQRERNKKCRFTKASCCLPKKICVIDENNNLGCIEAINVETEIRVEDQNEIEHRHLMEICSITFNDLYNYEDNQ